MDHVIHDASTAAHAHNCVLLLYPNKMATEGEREKKGSVYLIPPRASEKRIPQKRDPCKTIYVGSLPVEVNEQHLRDAFGDFGVIQAIRMNSTKRYCHIQFMREQSADKAMTYNNYWLRIGPENNAAHVSRLNVNYSHYKDTGGEGLQFTEKNLNAVCQQLKDKMLFDRACLQVKQWLESGCNTPETAPSFFALVSSIRDRAENVLEGSFRYNQEVTTMLEEARQSTLEHCRLIEEVLDVAINNPTAWDNFSKPQQNSVSGWRGWLKSNTTKLKEQSSAVASSGSEQGTDESPAKRMRSTDGDDGDAHYREEIRKLKADLEASKTKHLQELAAKQNQRHFEEWKEVSETELASQQGTEAEPMVLDNDTEVVGPSENHVDLSQDEIAIVSVLGTFLAVHPLGATLREITDYASVFSPQFKAHYIEGLLRKLPKVFRENRPSGENETKWWFLGFQSVSSRQ